VDRAALADAYEQGASLQACGRKFGISPPSVARLLREQGVTIRPPYSYRARADPAALAAAYAAGHTLAECGQQHGISAPTVARILRENGVTIRPARRTTGTRAVLAHRRRHPAAPPGRAR
jgi:AraC-like DNA-binding protein